VLPPEFGTDRLRLSFDGSMTTMQYKTRPLHLQALGAENERSTVSHDWRT
jgi:hypothetical protein